MSDARSALHRSGCFGAGSNLGKSSGSARTNPPHPASQRSSAGTPLENRRNTPRAPASSASPPHRPRFLVELPPFQSSPRTLRATLSALCVKSVVLFLAFSFELLCPRESLPESVGDTLSTF